ncbi:uncharacterized protein LOC110944542 [Helianthus annuus]|uniref:uncharacterized protein LOC110944542 n=1 Tax=Helianthus annuus TaxID=4232 RepID=UPI000B8F4E24|nr:uncharacterized protein LOC110944542 [Helianthus annuus]
MAIDTLTSANYASWKDSLNLTLALMEFNCALTENAPPALTDKSTEAEKLLHQKWERANRLSLIFMKNSISPAIRGAIPDATTTKEYLTNVETQFQGTSKTQASTLILKLVTTKYDGVSGIREHILKMNDMAQKLKGLSKEISDGFLVHFIMTSLPASYEAFKVNYNLQNDQWKMDELIAMCVQEEECLTLEKADVAYLMTADSKKRKGNYKKKPNVKVQKRDTGASASCSNDSKGKIHCKFCRKVGHKKNGCPDFKEWLAKKGDNLFVILESFNLTVPSNT